MNILIKTLIDMKHRNDSAIYYIQIIATDFIQVIFIPKQDSDKPIPRQSSCSGKHSMCQATWPKEINEQLTKQ